MCLHSKPGNSLFPAQHEPPRTSEAHALHAQSQGEVFAMLKVGLSSRS